MGLEPINVHLVNVELLRIANKLNERNDENSKRVAQHILQGHWVDVHIASRKQAKKIFKYRKKNVTIDQLDQPLAMVSAKSVGKKMVFLIHCLPDQMVLNDIGKFNPTRGFTIDDIVLMKIVAAPPKK